MTGYKDAGVDFESIGKFRRELISALKFKGAKYERASEIGHYAGLVRFMGGYLALHTDGVGTKTIYALKFNYFDEIGYDLVGMNVNDIVSIGAEPIAMVDYIASSQFPSEIGRKIGESINSACEMARIPVIGGETASVPDIVKGIDISGTVAGFLQEGKQVDGSMIKEGDLIIGLKSTGVHSNGFSLIRKIYSDREEMLGEQFNGEPFWKALMKGTEIYSTDIYNLIQATEVHGLAHITGGGIRNLNRLSTKKFKIDNFEISPIFLKIEEDGGLSIKEMFETFNMGYGYIIIIPPQELNIVLDSMKKYNPSILGRISNGTGVELTQFDLHYSDYY